MRVDLLREVSDFVVAYQSNEPRPLSPLDPLDRREMSPLNPNKRVDPIA